MSASTPDRFKPTIDDTQLLSPRSDLPRFRFLDVEASASEDSEDEQVGRSQVSGLFASQEESASPSDLRHAHAAWEEEADSRALAWLFRRKEESPKVNRSPGLKLRVKEKVKPIRKLKSRRKSRSAPPQRVLPPQSPRVTSRRTRRSSILTPPIQFTLARSIPLPSTSGNILFSTGTIESMKPFVLSQSSLKPLQLHSERFAFGGSRRN